MATTTKIYSDIAGTTATSSGSEIRNVQDYSKFNKDATSTGTAPTFSVDSNGNGSAKFETDASITQSGSFTGNALIVGQNKSIYFENISDSDLTIGMEGNLTNQKGLSEVGNILSAVTTDKDLSTDERRSIINYFSRKGGSQTEIYDYQAYDVNNKTPAVSLDFTGNGFYRNLPYYFRLGNTYASFADAFMGNSPKLTYNPGSASTSQSTMTQGYGPELVTNGGFDTDTDWDTGTGWTISDGQLTASSATGVVYQIVSLTGGKSYHITASNTANIQVRIIGGTGQSLGYFSGNNVDKIFTFTSGAGTRLEIVANGTTSGSIDNISIREAPKIVWAPHNLVEYSNDLTSWVNAWNGGVTLTPDDIVGPDGVNSLAKLARLDGANDAIFTTFELTAGLTYTVSFVAKAGTSTSSQVLFYDLGTLATSSNLSFSWGSPPTTTSSTNATNIDYADLGGGFYRISFSMVPNTTVGHRLVVEPASTGTSNEYIHFGQVTVYRSDLGGMAPIPGAATGFEYYVPTNGAAEYLPRVGHHVYNGSTWVNEGLLIESEVRTNLVTHSVPDNTNWTVTGLTLDDTTGYSAPDGTQGAVKLTSSGSGTNRVRISTAGPTNQTHSIYAKAVSGGFLQLLDGASGGRYANFDLNSGAVGSSGSQMEPAIEDCGNGWYRCSAVISGATDVSTFNIYVVDSSTAGYGIVSTSADEMLVYGAQAEAASTPSSYIPTNGSTVIRGGQSLVVPANWYDADNPTYTGPELVTNGDFSNGTTGWTAGNNAVISLDTQRLKLENGANSNGYAAYVGLTTVVGEVYQASMTVSAGSGTNGARFLVGTSVGSGNVLAGTFGSGQVVETFTATDTTTYVSVQLLSSTTGEYQFIDNVSVRQVSAPQFGWPEPEYIGPELVTDFSTYADQAAFDVDWTRGTGWTFSGGVATAVGSTSDAQYLQTNIGLVSGKAYEYSINVGGTLTGSNYLALRFGGTSDNFNITSTGTKTGIVVATGSGDLRIRSEASSSGITIDNISVREINPLSVSFQMDGRMTYVTKNTTQDNLLCYWAVDTNNRIYWAISSSGALVGAFQPIQVDGGYYDNPTTVNYFADGGLYQPFNFSARHGSTFVNAAVDGVALTANTTPTALPDLSNTNLEIAKNFMGTIGQFRQFAGDIGDAGLVTATNPSTEPTLSLTFDGTGGSFYNLSWSE